MDVQEVGKAVVFFVEKVLVEFGAGDDLASVKGEVFEKRVLTSGEWHLLGGEGHASCSGVDGEFADFNRGMAGSLRASDEGPDSGEEFIEIEGLRKVVVGTVIQSFDAVGRGVERRKHEHGSLVARTERLEDFPAVELRHQDIEKDCIVAGLLGFVETLFAVARSIDGVIFLSQARGEATLENRIVFDDEQAHGELGKSIKGAFVSEGSRNSGSLGAAANG